MATLDPTSRLYTCDITVFSLNSADIVGIFKDCRLRTNWDIVDARIPGDINDATSQGFKYNRTTRKGWSVELGTVLEKVANPILLAYYALTIASGSNEVDRGLVTVAISRPGGDASGANVIHGLTYIGNGYFTEARISIQENEPIMQNGTITGYGSLLPA